MAEYTIYVKNIFNQTIAVITEFYKLEYFRQEMGVGSLYLDLPLDKYGDINFEIDGRLEVWRKTPHTEPKLVGDTQWLIRLVRKKIDEQGLNNFRITCHDAVDILNKRIVAYTNGTAYTNKGVDYADDVMKEVVRENFCDLVVDTSRDISDWFDVAESESLAPQVSLPNDIGFRIVRPILDELCELSLSAGTYLTYDVIYDQSLKKFIFKTYVGQRGVDRSSTSQKRLIMSCVNDRTPILGRGLSYISSGIDALDERTFIYSGGKAEDKNTIYVTVADEERISGSPFGRWEDFIDASDPENTSYSQKIAEAAKWLNHKQRIIEINGHIEQTEGILYGRDYDFGDIVGIQYLGSIYNIHLDDLHVVVDENNKEEVTIFTRTLEQKFIDIEDEYLGLSEIISNDELYEEEDPYKFGLVGLPNYAQKINVPAGKEMYVSHIEVLMRKEFLGVPPFERENVRLDICTSVANTASLSYAIPYIPGTSIGNDLVTIDDIGASMSFVKFTFSPIVTLSEDTDYWLKFSRTLSTGGSNTNYFLFAVSKDNAYGDNYSLLLNDTVALNQWKNTNGSFGRFVDADLIFKIWGQETTV